MTLFSTLPHQRTTPRFPAGTMTNVPQIKMKMIRRITMIPIVRGFAPLNSKDSNGLSGMVSLP
jgi:hypothetical protein